MTDYYWRDITRIIHRCYQELYYYEEHQDHQSQGDQIQDRTPRVRDHGQLIQNQEFSPVVRCRHTQAQAVHFPFVQKIPPTLSPPSPVKVDQTRRESFQLIL